jgi:16S rRNA (uracil1498-N3)-methyltransferase
MTEPAPRHRLFVDAGLTAHAEIRVTEQQAHYLLNVMRLGAGAEIALFNGRDGEWRSRIVEAAKKKAVLEVQDQLRPQSPEPDLWLLFAAVKRARIDLIVEKATELGVSVLQPVFTERTVMSRVGEERLAAIAMEAAEQCERLTLPELRSPLSLSASLAKWPEGRILLMMDESGGGKPIAEALAELPQGPAALLVGPEGGFAKSELDALSRLSFAVRVGLGPRILRADTAVIAALACYQAMRGDWRGLSCS